VACSDDEEIPFHFDGPVAVTVLHPEQGGPFEEPVGFVSSSRSGQITPLDLKHGRILSDTAASSFLRAAYIATGRDRILGDIAVRAPDAEQVTLFVADMSHDLLVEAPYIVAMDGQPVRIEPVASDPFFLDADGSGDQASLDDLQLRDGYTTTEDWVLEYDGEIWEVTGSRSGTQGKTASFGEPYHSGYRELEFTISGSASAGDRIELSTDTGVLEHQVGGVVQGMALHPDQSLLALGVFDRDTGEGALSFFDPAAGALLGSLALADGSQPYRMVWTPAGDRLYVADASLPVAWELALDSADPLASTIRELPMPAALADLAYVDATVGERLAVAPVGLNRVDLYDIAQDAFIDPNTYTAEVEGVDLGGPVTGLAAAPFSVLLQETTEWGARLEDDVVAVSLFSGHMALLEVSTGCLAQDENGPRSIESSDDYFDFQDYGSYSDPYMWEDEATSRHIAVNSCAGVARDEEWSLIYDELQQGWLVEGSVSGLQTELARNDQRYVSDEGAISFTVMAGISPADDGDRYLVTVRDGILLASGDLYRDGDPEHAFELPGRPVVFWYDAGPTGGGWDELDRRAYALWPLMNSDFVARVRLSSGHTEIVWD